MLRLWCYSGEIKAHENVVPRNLAAQAMSLRAFEAIQLETTVQPAMAWLRVNASVIVAAPER